MIEIMSRKNASEFIENNKDYPIIAIGEQYSDDVKNMITDKATNCLCLIFDDVEVESPTRKTASKEQIQQAIDWAKDKDDLIVACRAGISRSSAIAYLIACSKSKPEEAVNILDMSIHQPNRLIIERGAKVLNDKKVEKTIDDWMADLYQKYL